ncbi:MAG: CsgG/HfaB family protein [Candidatus Zixiibacteriota bacterium]
MNRMTRWAAALMLGAALLMFAPATLLADAEGTLSQAQRLYNEGRLGEAIEMLTELAQSKDISGEQAKKAYLLLAKASAGKNFMDQSETYLKKILELDCHFELNLKTEPPQMRKAWFKAEETRDSLCPAQDRPDPGIKTLAVLYFENNSIADKESLDPLSKGLAAMMVTDLSQISGLKVVERERIQYILDEIKMEQSEYFDESSAVRVGKLLGAHTLLMGGFTKLDKNKMRIDARLIKTETGELLKAEKVEGSPRKLVELQAELALKMASNLDLTVAEDEAKAIKADKGESMEAVLAYTRGLNLEDEQKLSEAYEAYKEALGLAPEMSEARDRMTALEPLVVASGG